MLQRIVGVVREFLDKISREAVQNWIGRVRSFRSGTVKDKQHIGKWDWTRADYDFWRRAYYAKVRGLELSGPFMKPIVHKIAGWTLGREPYLRLQNEEARQELSDWWDNQHHKLLEGYRTALKLGDAFIVINPDLTVTVVPPDAVTPILDQSTYTDTVGWRIEFEFANPDTPHEKIRIIDEYTIDGRVHEVYVAEILQSREVFPNVIGRLPIIPIHNAPEPGATFGRPETEGLLPVFYAYNDVLTAGIEGNTLQGRPTPVMTFNTRQDMEKFWSVHGTTETVLLPDGTTERVSAVSVDLNELITLVDAQFEYISPGSFSDDTIALLEMLFYLILEHSELPEFVFGNAIGASRASAEAQLPVFIRFVESRQDQIAGWIKEVADVVVAYLRVLRPGISFGEQDELKVLFDRLDTLDGRLTLDTVGWAYREGLLDAETALRVSPLDVGDIEQVLEQADDEIKERVLRRAGPMLAAQSGMTGAADAGGGVQSFGGNERSGAEPLAQTADNGQEA